MRRRTLIFVLASALLGAVPVYAAIPEAPADLVAMKSPVSPKTTIDVHWTDQSDVEAGFRVERCTGSGCTDFVFIEQVGANATSVHNFDLPGGVTFRYRVQAFNDVGASAYSNEAEASTDPLNPPDAPSGLTAGAVAADRVHLAWQDKAANENGFFVERCAGAGCEDFGTVALAGSNATSVDDRSANASTTYRYRVQAHNDDGVSGYSNIAEATTPVAPPLAPPENLVARALRQGKRVSVELSWTDRSSDETGFQLERCSGANCSSFSAIAILAANTAFHRDATVARHSTYRYRVRALRENAVSDVSNVATASTP
jgi:hypothetical protein